MTVLSSGKYSGPHWDGELLVRLFEPFVDFSTDKATIQKYLEASGLANASVGTGDFLENLHTKCANSAVVRTAF